MTTGPNMAHPAHKSIFTISQHNRSLQLTREGGGFIVLAFAVGLGAINTGNNLLYLILAMCCSFIAVSGILSEITLRSLTVKISTEKNLYCRETYPLLIQVENTKKYLPSYSIHIEISPSIPPNFELNGSAYIFQIPAKAKVEKSIIFTPTRRGRLQIESCEIITSFPFGFFVKTKKMPVETEAVVYPEIRDIDLPIPDEASEVGEGVVQQHGDQLSALREFQPGDPMSSVHWKSSAKTGTLRVKEFAGGGHQRYTVFLNITDSQTQNKIAANILEDRVVESASLAYHLIRRGDEVSLKTSTQQTPFGNSESHLAGILKILAFIGLETETKSSSHEN